MTAQPESDPQILMNNDTTPNNITDDYSPSSDVFIPKPSSRFGLSFAYLLLLTALVTGFMAIFAYAIAGWIHRYPNHEIWVDAHARWIMRNSLIFMIFLLIAGLWFAPLLFYTWDFNMFTKTCTVVGTIFCIIAVLYLLNAWLIGVWKLLFRKAVF